MASMFLPSPSPISSPSHYTSQAPQPQSSYFLNLPSPSPLPLPPNDAIPRRPTLSLNTLNCPRSFNNRGQASLRLDTTLASPTQHNTHRNSIALPSLSPLATHTKAQPPPLPQKKLSLQVPSLRPTGPQRSVSDSVIGQERIPSSPLRVSTTTEPVPYARDPNLKSILVNGPLSIRSAPANFSTERVVKSVSFSEEPTEINTRHHTLRHSDIPSRSPSPASPLHKEETSSPLHKEETSGTLSLSPHVAQKHLLSSPTEDSQIYTLSSCHHAAEDGNGSDPRTPVAGRQKRQRDWRWTIGSADDEETESALPQDE